MTTEIITDVDPSEIEDGLWHRKSKKEVNAIGVCATFSPLVTLVREVQHGIMFFQKAWAAQELSPLAARAMESKATCCQLSGSITAQTTLNGGFFTEPNANLWRSNR